MYHHVKTLMYTVHVGVPDPRRVTFLKEGLRAERSVVPSKGFPSGREPGMIELATLPAAERTEREIKRLREDARSHPGDPDLQLHLALLLLADRRVEEAAAEPVLSGLPCCRPPLLCRQCEPLPRCRTHRLSLASPASRRTRGRCASTEPLLDCVDPERDLTQSLPEANESRFE